MSFLYLLPLIFVFTHGHHHLACTCRIIHGFVLDGTQGIVQNRFIKRLFDILVSATFLCTLFPIILVIVTIVTKLTMPGPVFFRQKRNGLYGKEFYCYKFRSMHVNADADKVQATENDPRKFPFGDFMRRANIDELPL